jgi:hypothetical protein
METRMQCLKCGGIVVNPRVVNLMTERCTPCEIKYKEMAEFAIDTYLHNIAEQKEQNA